MTNTELSQMIQAMGQRAGFRKPVLPSQPGHRPEEIGAYTLQLFDHLIRRLEALETKKNPANFEKPLKIDPSTQQSTSKAKKEKQAS